MQELLLFKKKIIPPASNTTLLMHMQGVNGSNVFVDSSPTPKTATALGQAKLNSTVKMYGTTSAQITLTGDGIVVPEAFPDGFRSSPWTFETYFRSCAPDTYAAIASIGTQQGGSGGIIFSTEGVFVGVSGGWYTGGPVLKVAWAACDWRHFACTYDLTTITIYFNGNRVGTIPVTAAQIQMSNPKYLMLGKNYTNSNRLQGYIQEVRVTKGLIYTGATYTLPAYPLVNI